MFKVEARAYPSVAPGLIHKRKTRLEKNATDKHSNLLQALVNYGRKMFYNAETWSTTDVGGVATADVIGIDIIIRRFDDGGADAGGTDVEIAGRGMAACGDDRDVM